jgi:hypothetical protein
MNSAMVAIARRWCPDSHGNSVFPADVELRVTDYAKLFLLPASGRIPRMAMRTSMVSIASGMERVRITMHGGCQPSSSRHRSVNNCFLWNFKAQSAAADDEMSH